MSFANILSKHLETINMEQKELAKKLNVSKQTISAYITGRSNPTYKALVEICKIFNKDANYFMQDDLKCTIKHQINVDEEIFISKYRKLSQHDKDIIKYIIEVGEKSDNKIMTLYQPTQEYDYIYVCSQKASAGIGKINDDSNNDLRLMCFEKNIVPQGATHGIIIDGHSMEDKFFDKQIVFIQNGLECNTSDYGIFSVTDEQSDTKIYCKQLMQKEDGNKYLHSLNVSEGDPDIDYKNAINIHCVGKILE